jgi:hypothetical protein
MESLGFGMSRIQSYTAFSLSKSLIKSLMIKIKEYSDLELEKNISNELR